MGNRHCKGRNELLEIKLPYYIVINIGIDKGSSSESPDTKLFMVDFKITSKFFCRFFFHINYKGRFILM